MPSADEMQKQEIIEKIALLVHERVPDDQRPQVEHFVRQYFGGTAAEDLVESDPVDLYGAAMAHWNFARQRTIGTPKLHVYNPQFEQHGWQSTHTIVEIVVDDMPFLVDSVRMALNRRGLTSHLVIHPVFGLRRDEQGRLTEIFDQAAGTEGAVSEAIIHCEVDRQAEKEALQGIHDDVAGALRDVRVAVEDWRQMRDRLGEVLDELKQNPPPVEKEELDEARAFLEWVDNNHYTFLGFRDYELMEDKKDEIILRSIAGSGLGILRDHGTAEVSQSFAALPVEIRRLARDPRLLVVTKGNFRSTVHRSSYVDYVGIKRLDAKGNVVGERRFLGLYTSAAYNRVPRDIPLLRRKNAAVVARAGFPRSSHATKALQNILDTFPRDELFQIPVDELFEITMGILNLQERQRIRLFVHRDIYGRFFSCIVYVPRDRFNTQIRLRIQDILEEAFGGADTDTEFTVHLTESVLARLYFVVRVKQGTSPAYDVKEIEARLTEVSRVWTDDLHTALLEHYGEEQGTRLYRRYGGAFRADYREIYSPRVAVHDIEKMEGLEAARGLAMTLYRPLEAPQGELRLRLFHPKHTIPLSDVLPMLENMGLKVDGEHPSKIKLPGDERIWVHDFAVTLRHEGELDLDQVKGVFQDAFARVWHREVENDGFNRLVLRAGLDWREVVVLRAYCKYLRQVRVTFSQAYMEQALFANSHIAQRLVKLFQRRFNPVEVTEASALTRLETEIAEALDEVANLDEDRILRSFLSLVQATLRTNFYQTTPEGGPKSYVSFKFDPSRIPDLPEPRPMFEIFVYSPRVEGVHLRGGTVARGGLRWSDRREDFRTEVLGLVKAQMVKNAVIVPVGSKGGFLPKMLPAGGDREAIQAEGIACYKTFISGLLDITDNLVGGNIVPPPDVVRHDEDDPYLVVAADKGTATFSDIANGIAIDYGFWLGDAFASGGSAGYDHKGMGITARGAWESVKRHFRELGVDIQTTDFTAAGIGDMAGDVFGNGMLLSKHIRLVAAFNHMHIFLDPDPDAATSYKERERLFNLPRSSWTDYDETLISKGGGIYPRSAKSIPLSPEVQRVLDINKSALAPNELLRAILRAPVDLFWNGGIGTYVKASGEQHSDAGDRANDAVRIDATELRCQVVGEGGNLGFTQLGRVEAAMLGRRINTDAIDNAAGVDCSDHEVNIKILLNAVVADGDMTEKQRNKLLADMTDEVGALVLRNNYLQTEALSLAGVQAAGMLDVHARFIQKLERDGDLDPSIEFLPDVEEIHERKSAGRGLSSPEISVLLAYTKITLFQELLESDLPAATYLAQELESYFPTPLREGFRERMPQHRLSREIISTLIANDLVNKAGLTFAFRLGEETGADIPDIARAYMVAREVFDMPRFWDDVEGLDNKVPAQIQSTMLLEARKLVERASRWLLRNRPRPIQIADTIDYFKPGISALEKGLSAVLMPSVRESMEHAADKLVEIGVSKALAARMSGFNELFSALDIVEVSTVAGMTLEEVAAVYFRLGEALELHWLRDQIVGLPRENRWQALSRAALRDDLYHQESVLTADVLRLDAHGSGTIEQAESRIASWMTRNETAVTRCRHVMADLKSGGTPDFTMLSVAMREIRALRELEAPPATAEVKKPVAARKRRVAKAS